MVPMLHILEFVKAASHFKILISVSVRVIVADEAKWPLNVAAHAIEFFSCSSDCPT